MFKELESRLASVSDERFKIEQSLKTKLNEVEELKAESEKQNLLLLDANKVITLDFELVRFDWIYFEFYSLRNLIEISMNFMSSS